MMSFCVIDTLVLYHSHLLPALSQYVGPVQLSRDDTDTALGVISDLLLVLRLQRWPNIKLT